MEDWLKNPSPLLEERIESAKRRAHQVRVKIQQDVVRTPGVSIKFTDLLYLLRTPLIYLL